MKDLTTALEYRSGALAEMAQAGVNIEVKHNDHDDNLILVVDDPVRGRTVADAWMRARKA